MTTIQENHSVVPHAGESDDEYIRFLTNDEVLKTVTANEYVTDVVQGQRRRKALSGDMEKKIFDLRASGQTLQKIADSVGLTKEGVRGIIRRQNGGKDPRPRTITSIKKERGKLARWLLEKVRIDLAGEGVFRCGRCNLWKCVRLDSRTYSPITIDQTKQFLSMWRRERTAGWSFLTDVNAIDFNIVGTTERGVIHIYEATIEYTFLNQALKIDVFGVLPHDTAWTKIEQNLPFGVNVSADSPKVLLNEFLRGREDGNVVCRKCNAERHRDYESGRRYKSRLIQNTKVLEMVADKCVAN